ncbi:Cof-type HAD-IIB family hydrolase [Camelliibacillus cellulosilyticus]|uniref:Cof-type HAD-IIB family hydrolase n=1 Tax=Camelliibacillus cellulosilyticus TaxID=2174486 RepID=A0ABV9GQZ0_9BACL
MEPYLIALDLDGTLLSSEKKILNRTKKAILEAKSAGHFVVISTGRPYRASQPYYEELGLTTPIVNFNGAYVHHPLDPEWGVFHTPLELETVKEILKTCDGYQLKNIIIEVMDDVYIKNEDPEIVDSFTMGAKKLVYGPIEETLKASPSSILIQTEDREVDHLLQALESDYADAIEQRSWGSPSNIIEIVRRGINKAIGLKRVADRLGVPKERIIAFGDEDNDIEMLRFAGCGVAMGNALESLKHVADTETATNDEDGIALFLEKHVLHSVLK